jgi:hypothetical protein
LSPIINRIFYALKPLIPRSSQIALRRMIAKNWRRKYAHIWPIDPGSATPPQGWPGWPGGKEFALVLSHDVDTRKGYDNVLKLADLEEQMGFRSQFCFVPERYGEIEMGLIGELRRRGFGIAVHGLNHDGKLFNSKEIFEQGAQRINAYLGQWGTRAFTTPSMIRNHEWMSAQLDVDYCVSTFDTDPFEPQSEGAGTIFPYWVQSDLPQRQFLELPYTLVQDFTLFVLLGEKSIDTWTQKLDWIASKGGMALLNSHPDYMNFGSGPNSLEEYTSASFCDFLKYVQCRHGERHWHALPSQLFDFLEAHMPVQIMQTAA